jgi:hypothetical protein
MGYRSEVAYCIQFDKREDMDTWIGLQLVKKDEHITEALKELQLIQSTQPSPILFFYASDVKWYEDFPDVQAHMNFLTEATKMFDTASALFFRCGESADDLEEEAYGENGWDLTDYININRPSISTRRRRNKTNIN